MASTKTYNGWANYETWCVNLWLSNDQGLYEEANDLARRHFDADDPDSNWAVADAFKDWVDELVPLSLGVEELPASFVSDLIGAALSEVDWSEIANAWLEDLREEAKAEKEDD